MGTPTIDPVEFKPVKITLGNTNPQMQVEIVNPDATPQEIINGWHKRYVSRPALHLQGNKFAVSRIKLRGEAIDPKFVNLTLSTRNDRYLSAIGDFLATKGKAHHAVAVHEIESLLSKHSAGTAPSWVWSEDPDLAASIAAHFECPIATDPGGPSMIIHNSGRDAVHDMVWDIGGQPAAMGYMLISTDTASSVATQTTVPDEVNDSGESGGLVRKTGTFAHTSSTNTSTLTATWTVNSDDTGGPWAITKGGIINASSSGILGWSDLLGSASDLASVGDSTTITATMTAG